MTDPQQYEQFRAALLARHEHPVTARIATLGDVAMLAGLGMIPVRRLRATAFLVVGFGLALANVAHLFQPGTLLPENKAIMEHPLWAARAEAHRVRLAFARRTHLG
ncbi:hypothetical protein ACQEVB_28670 [Pseudonocardia sp. CA-107938]|uniref:hypothetical protein n=1 Tax=Pseudonocardia sp. CA-107938 TaxID=3240021 RepID=UPI003D8D2ABD